MYKFDRYTDTNSKHETRLSLTKTYGLGIPTAFYHEQEVYKFKYAILFYDKVLRAIAIKLTNDSTEPGKFTISHDKGRQGANLSITSFLKKYEISPFAYHGKYPWKKENVEGIGEIYIIELRNKNDIQEN